MYECTLHYIVPRNINFSFLFFSLFYFQPVSHKLQHACDWILSSLTILYRYAQCINWWSSATDIFNLLLCGPIFNSYRIQRSRISLDHEAEWGRWQTMNYVAPSVTRILRKRNPKRVSIGYTYKRRAPSIVIHDRRTKSLNARLDHLTSG